MCIVVERLLFCMNQDKMPSGHFRQTNAFAMNYALPFGIYQIAGLLCFVNGFTHSNAMLGFMFVFVSTPFVAYYFVLRFRSRACEGVLPLGRGYMFSLLLYFYAALLLALAVYLYFEFVDGGRFFAGYVQYLDSPEVKRLFANGGMEQMFGGLSLKEMKTVAETLEELSSVAVAANILDFNIFAGLLLSLPTALLAMIRPKKHSNR